MFGCQLEFEIGVDADIKTMSGKYRVVFDEQFFDPLLFVLSEDRVVPAEIIEERLALFVITCRVEFFSFSEFDEFVVDASFYFV